MNKLGLFMMIILALVVYLPKLLLSDNQSRYWYGDPLGGTITLFIGMGIIEIFGIYYFSRNEPLSPAMEIWRYSLNQHDIDEAIKYKTPIRYTMHPPMEHRIIEIVLYGKWREPNEV